MLKAIHGNWNNAYTLEEEGKLVIEVAEENSDPIAYYFTCTDEKLMADLLKLFTPNCYRIGIHMKEKDVESRKVSSFNIMYKKYSYGGYIIRKSIFVQDLSGADAPNNFEITSTCDKVRDTKSCSVENCLQDALEFIENESYMIKE